MITTLRPTLDDLRLTCVLMQAWKKASKYIRRHNWYADTLELDYQSLRLPLFLNEIQSLLQAAPRWNATPLRIVPAPKSQKWQLDDVEGQAWHPVGTIKDRIRPLGHVSLVDQVVTTAIMMCMADRVESMQGDPNLDPVDPVNRKATISYGNRLFCDAHATRELRHSWGSGRLYRQYFADYRTFLRRPRVVTEEISSVQNQREIAVVQSDLSRFYDRVTPLLLMQKVRDGFAGEADETWFQFIEEVFKWSWRKGRDLTLAKRCSFSKSNLSNYDVGTVALPQGLVASGFFANLVLNEFDNAVINNFGSPIDDRGLMVIEDVCRYVDDFRVVLSIERGASPIDETDIQHEVAAWLQKLLDRHAEGLFVDKEQTRATVEGREQRFLVQQSRAANRIQNDVSGTFDMLHGTELLGAIEGFFYTQKRYSQEQYPKKETTGLLVGTSDIRDDTAARFAAGRFRRVFRSLRPLLEEGNETSASKTNATDTWATKLVLTKEQLDERGQLFAAMLIEEWVSNPSNVRLLRIALDFYPDAEFLSRILKILRDGWSVSRYAWSKKAVKQYCLAEVFRAGATETGIVGDEDCLPDDIDLSKYHEVLVAEANAILRQYSNSRSSSDRFAWYLIQQVYLYLIARNLTKNIPLPARKSNQMLALYQNVIAFLNNEKDFSVNRRVSFSTLLASAFGIDEILFQQPPTARFIEDLCLSTPKLALKYWDKVRDSARKSCRDTARHLGVEVPTERYDLLPLAANRTINPFWDEENLLLLAREVAQYLAENDLDSPWQIRCTVTDPDREFEPARLESVRFTKEYAAAKEFFVVPDWAQSDDDNKLYKLGLVLRFALRGSIDFFSARSSHSPRQGGYRVPISHWEQQQYSGYQGRKSFAPDWIPISSWMENLLFQLLRWPGCGLEEREGSFDEFRQGIVVRHSEIKEARQRRASNLLFLEQVAPMPITSRVSKDHRRIRIGVVQTAFPNLTIFESIKNTGGDPTLSDPVLRAQSRRHLVTMLEGIEQMLRVRQTHSVDQDQGGFLDLLIFPELAVHPNDVAQILLTFARIHRCIILAGLVFHPFDNRPTSPIINSAIWLIPDYSTRRGLEIRRFEQGKKHLTELEYALNPNPIPFRLAQWIINYEWETGKRPLRLSAAICYDSTELDLATDLKNETDLFLICALNKDVGTFDRMVESLHYHMYQGVLIANNGEFGGSSIYLPFKTPHHRQVFHVHGQPQAQIAFIEADPEKLVCKGTHTMCFPCTCDPFQRNCRRPPVGTWKQPPAGWYPRTY